MTERSADQGKWWRKAFVTIPAIGAFYLGFDEVYGDMVGRVFTVFGSAGGR